jgi:hypothetical protein
MRLFSFSLKGYLYKNKSTNYSNKNKISLVLVKCRPITGAKIVPTYMILTSKQ